jgi:hypothetical protein
METATDKVNRKRKPESMGNPQLLSETEKETENDGETHTRETRTF